MSRWYSKIAETEDLSPIADAFVYFDDQYEEARKEMSPNGRRIEDLAKTLPGIVEHRWGQLQEIEAILKLLELRLDRAKGAARRRYLEHYERSLSERMAEKYADCDPDVTAFAELIIQVSLVRNKFVSLTKGYEYLHFQLSNITKLRVAGIEDATL